MLRRTLSPEAQTTQTTESTFPAGNRLPTWIPVNPPDSQPSLGQRTGRFNSLVGHDRSADGAGRRSASPGQEPEPARRAPVRAAGGSAIGRTLASSRAVAAPTPDRRLGDENDLPLDVHSVSPPLIVRQPSRPDRNIHADRSGDEPIRQGSDGPPSSLHHLTATSRWGIADWASCPL